MFHVLKGHDTTSAGVSFAIHLLGSHPEIQVCLSVKIKNVTCCLMELNLR